MKVDPTPIEGVRIIEAPVHEDERGTFARVWCRRELERRDISTDFVQCSLSRTHRRGTIRGLHWQEPPHAEDKLVRCVNGTIWDVAVDLRPDSATYLQHFGTELDAEGGRALLIPKGCAHGFQTLTDDAAVLYHMTAFYEPDAGRGARWDDPAFDIAWPLADPTLHPRDASYPDFP